MTNDPQQDQAPGIVRTVWAAVAIGLLMLSGFAVGLLVGLVL